LPNRNRTKPERTRRRNEQIAKENLASEQTKKENKNMNNFKQNEYLELLLRTKKTQPDLYAKIPAAAKMSLGIYEGEKARAVNTGLTTDEVLRLRGLKLSIASDNLSPSERITKSLEITNLEKRIG
jgi:hypothetical protein